VYPKGDEMTTVGLDIATHTGICIVGSGDPRGQVVEFKGHKGMVRLQLIAAEVDRLLDSWNPDLVLVEAYAPNAINMKTVITQVEVGTVIKQVLHRRVKTWVEVKPSTLKLWFTGKGNAKKDAMAEKALRDYGYQSPSTDIIDAFALAQMGQLDLEALLQIPGVTIVN
jgi:Holliday junction resolvasome RuvABC endonuclease subunit